MRLNLSVSLVQWASADVLSFWWLEATLRLQGLLTLQALFYYQPSSPWTIPSHTLSLETSPETNPLPNSGMLYPTLVSGNTKLYETDWRIELGLSHPRPRPGLQCRLISLWESQSLEAIKVLVTLSYGTPHPLLCYGAGRHCCFNKNMLLAKTCYKGTVSQ